MNQISFYTIKILDITLVGIYFVILGIICSVIIEKMFSYDSDNTKEVLDKKKTIIIILEILLQAAVIMIAAYFTRKIVKHIPFPLDGVGGYEHSQLKEINGGVLISFSIMIILSQFKEKILYLLRDRFKINMK